MKKHFITIALLLAGMTCGMAQEKINRLELNSASDVTIVQSHDPETIPSSMPSGNQIVKGCLIVNAADDIELAFEELVGIKTNGTGDIDSKGILQGANLRLTSAGSGDVELHLEYDSVFVEMMGCGDVDLKGSCNYLHVQLSGAGDLDISKLNVENKYIVKTGVGAIHRAPHERREEHGCHPADLHTPKKRSYLLRGHWQGFELGPNMLLNENGSDQFVADNVMAPKGLGGICLNFNLAEIGFAFDRKRECGLFTGIGLSMNIFKMKNPYYFYQDKGITQAALLDKVNMKSNRLTVFYLQAPLMVQVGTGRGWYLQAGVIGGLRLVDRQRMKFGSNDNNSVMVETSGDPIIIPVNETKLRNTDKRTSTFKLDACLRAGGDDFGFFVSYSLTPLFSNADFPEYHPIMVGASLLF